MSPRAEPRWEWHASGCGCARCDAALARTGRHVERAAFLLVIVGAAYIAARVTVTLVGA